MFVETQVNSSAAGLRIGLVVSRYHIDITSAMRRAAIDAFTEAGGRDGDLVGVEAPGAFELPVMVATLARRDDIDAVVAVGCVITGETTHDQHIAQAVAGGLTAVSVETSTPVTFGVLTCRNLDQARERAGGAKGNKGADAMRAAIEAVCVLRELTTEKRRV